MTERKQATPKILCAGIGVQDILMRVETFPSPGTKVHASDYITTGGGCAANAAIAAARLGVRASFAGPLGSDDDPISREIVSGLEREGVDCGGVVRVPGGSASVSLILLDAAGEKMIATRRGDGLAQAVPADAVALVAGAGAVLADNRFPEFVTPICQAARSRGLPVVIDFDQATAPDDPVLSLGTHIVASAEALRGSIGGDLPAALEVLAETLDSFVAVTDGPNGVFWIGDGVVRHLPAFAVNAVDTLGAGDAFHGGFTAALLEGMDVAASLHFAAAVAAIKCTRFGGMAGAPTRSEVDALLSTRPRN